MLHRGRKELLAHSMMGRNLGPRVAPVCMHMVRPNACSDAPAAFSSDRTNRSWHAGDPKSQLKLKLRLYVQREGGPHPFVRVSVEAVPFA
jgi:hypothetical protein